MTWGSWIFPTIPYRHCQCNSASLQDKSVTCWLEAGLRLKPPRYALMIPLEWPIRRLSPYYFYFFERWTHIYRLPRWHNSKESACWTQETISGLERFPGIGNGNLFQYACLDNSMNRGDWQATVHGVSKSWTWLNYYKHTYMNCVLPLPIQQVLLKDRCHYNRPWLGFLWVNSS